MGLYDYVALPGESRIETLVDISRGLNVGFSELVTHHRPDVQIQRATEGLITRAADAPFTNRLLVAQLWFHIPFAGSFATLYAGLAVFLFAAVGIGLLVSSLVATMQQAMLFAFMVMMPFVLLSGLTTPLSSMPPALQYVTVINPLRYAIEITQKVYLEGASLSQLVPQLWPLAVIASVTLGIAAWMFRHRLA